MDKKHSIFPFRISDKFKKRLKKAAEYLDMTMSEFIRLAVNEKIDRGSK